MTEYRFLKEPEKMRPDLLWLEYGHRVNNYVRVGLVCESENEADRDKIYDNLVELSLIDADVKLMICYQEKVDWVVRSILDLYLRPKEKFIGKHEWFCVIVDDYVEGQIPDEGLAWFLTLNSKGHLIERGIAKTYLEDQKRCITRPKWFAGDERPSQMKKISGFDR